MEVNTRMRADTFYAQLPPAARSALAHESTPVAYEARMAVVRESMASGSVLVIQNGWALATTSAAAWLGGTAVLRLYGPGDVVGDTAVLGGLSKIPVGVSEGVYALSRVHAWMLPADRFLGFLRRHSAAVNALLTVVRMRLEEADRRSAINARASGAERLADLLVEIADRHGERRGDMLDLPIPLTQEELASWSHGSRGTVARALRDWRERGLVRTARGRITILDLEGLRQEAGRPTPRQRQARYDNGEVESVRGLADLRGGSDPPGWSKSSINPGVYRLHQPDIPQASDAWLETGQPAEVTFVAIDIAGFGQYSTEVQMNVRALVYQMLFDALGEADVAWQSCQWEDRGDGLIMVLPPSIPATVVVDTFIEKLRTELRRYNRIASSAAQIRLRMAAHIGSAHFDAHGLAGSAIVQVARLLDAPAFKFRAAASSAGLGVAFSDDFYHRVIRYDEEGGIDTRQLIRITAKVKEDHVDAWVYAAPSYAPLDELYARKARIAAPRERTDAPEDDAAIEEYEPIPSLLDRMPGMQLRILALTAEGLTPTQIAERLGTSSNAVSASLRGTRELLDTAIDRGSTPAGELKWGL